MCPHAEIHQGITWHTIHKILKTLVLLVIVRKHILIIGLFTGVFIETATPHHKGIIAEIRKLTSKMKNEFTSFFLKILLLGFEEKKIIFEMNLDIEIYTQRI